MTEEDITYIYISLGGKETSFPLHKARMSRLLSGEDSMRITLEFTVIEVLEKYAEALHGPIK